MRNRKFVAVGLAAAMTLTACGGSKTAETTASTTVAATTTAAETTVAETTTEETTAPESEGVKTDLNVATSERLGITVRYPGEKVDVNFVESDENPGEEVITDESACFVMLDPTGFTSLILYAAAADVYADDLDVPAETETDAGVDVEAESEVGESTNTGKFTSLKWYGAVENPEESMLGADWVIMQLEGSEPETLDKKVTVIMTNIQESNIMLMFMDTCLFEYDGMIVEYNGDSLTLDMSDETDNSELMKQSLGDFTEGLENAFSGMDVSADWGTEVSVPELTGEGDISYTSSVSGKVYRFVYKDAEFGTREAQSLADNAIGLTLDDNSYKFYSTELNMMEAGLEDDTTHEVPFGKLYKSASGWVWDSEDGFAVDIKGEGAIEVLTGILVTE